MCFLRKLSVLLILLAVSSVNAVGVDIEAGKAKATSVCVACHGADGNSANPAWPKLAGQHSSYLVKQLQDFKNEVRKDAMMAGQAKALSDADMLNISAFLSSQALKGGKAASLDGEKMYRAGNAKTGVTACIACHGADGRGNESAKFPRLAGQHAAYTEKALKDFRSGTRANDLNGMMQGIAKGLTDKEIADVAQYIQGLK